MTPMAASAAIQRIFSGQTEACAIRGTSGARPRILLSGAFNPLHQGHRKMALIATELISGPVSYEISIDNVDKPTLTESELLRRLAQFSEEETVWVTRAATFAEKSVLFPGVVFAIGADTLQRIALPEYYRNSMSQNNNLEQMQEAIAQIEEQGCRLLVFGRLVENRFLSMADFPLSNRLRDLCEPVPESLFREDLSSTTLRKR
jgi:hypothetical protein